MPYPTKLLNDNEEVVADLHPHWWHFAKPVAALVGAVIFGIVMVVWTDSEVVLWIAIIVILSSAACCSFSGTQNSSITYSSAWVW